MMAEPNSLVQAKKAQLRPTILWVDDDEYFMSQLVGDVRDEGFEVLMARGPDEALEILERQSEEISLVILDMMMRPGEKLNELETKGGYATGLALARRILRDYSVVRILAFSVASEAETMEWFSVKTAGYLIKPARAAEVIRAIQKALGLELDEHPYGLRSFIVHGHDDAALYQLKNYLQSTLGLPEPVILRDQPSHGRTTIEKFEDAATKTDLVFVLMTPDDASISKSAHEIRRARQNVVFELGFFYAKLQRQSGRILILYKGSLEIPSDISGVGYIDISNGIESAGEQIRRELKPWLRIGT